MNRHEALEWAADFMERSKVFEGASLSPAAMLDMMSTFADSVVTPDAPRVKVEYREPDPNCITYLRQMTDNLKTASGLSAKRQYATAIKQHLDALENGLAPHPPHNDPTEVDPE